MTRTLPVAVALIVPLLAPRVVAAQEPQTPDPAETARYKFGPLYFDSSFTLKNLGTDTNVFAEAENPREDFTGTAGASLTGGVRMGWARITFLNNTDYVYYHRYRSEGGSNRSGKVRLEFALARVHPYLSYDSLNTNERPRHEIDARARRTQPAYAIGSEIALGLRTRVDVQVNRSKLEFLPGERFHGVDLGEALNQRTNSANLSFKYSLTPLTTLTITSMVSRTRFDVSKFRDGNNFQITTGFDFQPSALLAGSASLGVRRFTALGPFVPNNTGPSASVSLSYSGLGSTRISGTLQRSLEFSIEERYPYYVVVGGTITLSQRIAGPVDLVMTVGRDRSSYQKVVNLELPDLSETISTATAGLGYRFARGMRWGFNVEFYGRRSPTRRDREYHGTRMYASVTYGK